jgi:hypothetical protein
MAEEKGWNAFYKLIRANRKKTFEVEMESGDVFEIRYDSEFEDDGKMSDETELVEQSFYTVCAVILKIEKNVKHHYAEGDLLLLNPRNTPKSYRIL